MTDDKLVEAMRKCAIALGATPPSIETTQKMLAIARPAIRNAALDEAAKLAWSFRAGEQLIRHKMSEVDQVGVVSKTIREAILALKSKEPPHD